MTVNEIMMAIVKGQDYTASADMTIRAIIALALIAILIATGIHCLFYIIVAFWQVHKEG